MKISIYTDCFAPQVGGQETAARLLSTGLAGRGHDVTVLCENSGPSRLDSIRVERALPWWKRARAQRAADANIVFGSTVKGLSTLPLGRNNLIWHHAFLPDSEPRVSSLLRRGLLRRGRNLAVSNTVGRRLPVLTEILPNAFDDSVFGTVSLPEPTMDLLFVGRLVSDKGADLLIRALERMGRSGLYPTLTIVGTGPEENSLRAQALRLPKASRIQFAGIKVGEQLALTYRQHRILVVPSIWAEPFGIVALEGLACGCSLVLSDLGGLAEASGGHCVIFKSGDDDDLARKITPLLNNPRSRRQIASEVAEHLRRHSSSALIDRFESILQQTCR